MQAIFTFSAVTHLELFIDWVAKSAFPGQMQVEVTTHSTSRGNLLTPIVLLHGISLAVYLSILVEY